MARILVVEDEADIRDLLCRFLQLLGHEVQAAADATETERIVCAFTPELVLMDLSLSGDVDGFEVTRRLRSDRAFDAVPIVAVTAHAMPEHRRRALEAGCDAHWPKPIIDLAAFADAVSSMVTHGRPSPRPG